MFAARLQHKGANQFSGGQIAVALDNPVRAGSLLLVFVHWNSNTVTATCADNLNGAHTAIDNPVTNGSIRAATFQKNNVLPGTTTVTVTFSSDPGGATLVVHEVHRQHTTAPIDQHAINGQSSVTSVNGVTSGAPLAMTTKHQYIFGAVASDNLTALLAGSGFTPRNLTAPASEDLYAASGSAQVTFTNPNSFETTLCAIVTVISGNAKDYPSNVGRYPAQPSGLSRSDWGN